MSVQPVFVLSTLKLTQLRRTRRRRHRTHRHLEIVTLCVDPVLQHQTCPTTHCMPAHTACGVYRPCNIPCWPASVPINCLRCNPSKSQGAFIRPNCPGAEHLHASTSNSNLQQTVHRTTTCNVLKSERCESPQHTQSLRKRLSCHHANRAATSPAAQITG